MFASAHKSRVSLTLIIVALSELLVISCKREERNFHVEPPAAQTLNDLRLSVLEPGPSPHTNEPIKNAYEDNAFAMSEGKRLFSQFNCAGCHAHGGGWMGPPLMDDKWLYGSKPEQVYATIVQGRPNGMPSFGGKIPDYQVWQLAAYVRSMSGLASSGAAPGRDDHLSGKKPENSADTQKPVDTGIPKSAEMPK